MCASKDQYFSKVINKVEVRAILIEFYTFSFIQTTLFCVFCSFTCSAFISFGCSRILTKIYCCSGCKWRSVVCQCCQIIVGCCHIFIFQNIEYFSLGVIKLSLVSSVRPVWLDKLNSNDFQARSKSM